MKTPLFLSLTLMLVLQSCGPKKDVSTDVNSSKNKFVLAAFNDMVTASSFKPEALTSLPKMINFSNQMTAVKNQGDRGTCTFFAATALVEAAIKQDLGIDVNLSEEYLIYSTKKQGHYDDVEASHMSVNLQSMKAGGILLERDWSYYPSYFEPGKPCGGIDGEKENAPMECYAHTPAQSILQKVIPANSIKTGFMRKNTNDIIKYLAQNQRPLSISLPVNYKGWKDWGEVTYTEEMRQQCLADSSQCGAHSVILTGYNLEEKVFYFKNSWGDDWGEAGFGTLSFDMIDRYVDGYLYYAKVEGGLDIPKDYEKDHLNFNDIEIKASLNEDLEIDITFNKSHAGGRYIEIQNVLTLTYVDAYGDEVTENIQMPTEESVEQNEDKAGFYLNSIGDTLNIDFSLDAPVHRMIIPAQLFQYKSVKEMMELPEAKLTVLTGMFLYSDKSKVPEMTLVKKTPVSR